MPMVTPFTGRGDIDIEASARITEHLVAGGGAVFALGTTGEGASVAHEPQAQFIASVVQQNACRAIVYAGVSDTCLTVSIEMAKRYADLGADVAVAHLPSYYPLTDDDILAYCERLAQRIPIPLMLYNIPVTTGMSISLDVLERLSHHPNIVGLKDSENDTQRLQQAIALWKDREDFAHLTGCGSLCALALSMGSDGIVPGAANLAPTLFVDLYEAGSNGRHEEASRLQVLADAVADIFRKDRPLSRSLPILKEIMHLLGFCQSNVVPPLRTLAPRQLWEIDGELSKLRIMLGEHGYALTAPAETSSVRIRAVKGSRKDAKLRTDATSVGRGE